MVQSLLKTLGQKALPSPHPAHLLKPWILEYVCVKFRYRNR